MAGKNTRKYRCYDCGNTLFLHPVHLGRASRSRCPKCGCSFLEPVTDGAKEQQTNSGTSRAARKPSLTGREHVALQDKTNNI